MKQKFEKILNSALPGFTLARAGLILLGAAIASFGLYNIHQQSGITEGGVLGTVLLLHHWLGWPASVITPVLDISCYLLALKVLGTDFIKWSVASTLCVSGFFRLWECWPPMLPDLSGHPLLAAVLGAAVCWFPFFLFRSLPPEHKKRKSAAAHSLIIGTRGIRT